MVREAGGDILQSSWDNTTREGHYVADLASGRISENAGELVVSRQRNILEKNRPNIFKKISEPVQDE